MDEKNKSEIEITGIFKIWISLIAFSDVSFFPIKIAISGKKVQYSFTLKEGNFFKTKALWYKNLEKNPLNHKPYMQYDLYNLEK